MNFTPSFLSRNATPQQLEQAAAFNHKELYCLDAVCQGGQVISKNGLTWTYSGAGKTAMIPFPSLDEEQAGEQLDEMMAYYRTHSPQKGGCWSLYPSKPADLGIKLLARGFQPGWQPCWMSLDLEEINITHQIPAGLEVKAANDAMLHNIKELPYSGNNGVASKALIEAYPERMRGFIATLDEQIVGHSCVFLADGEYGTAGLYSVGVLPQYRNKGIGKSVVTAACLYAREKGYHYATLNATGRRMYHQVGFQWVGNGHTWWLNNQRFITHPPSPEQVAFAEAVGKGEIALLGQQGHRFSPEELNTPITNGMTLIQLATHCRQPASAEWLINHKATYTALDAWDLGWKDRAMALLAEAPAEVNRLYGHMHSTLLHIAAERNDAALAQLALNANADREIKDKTYQATALEWAVFLRKENIVRIINEYKK